MHCNTCEGLLDLTYTKWSSYMSITYHLCKSHPLLKGLNHSKAFSKFAAWQLCHTKDSKICSFCFYITTYCCKSSQFVSCNLTFKGIVRYLTKVFINFYYAINVIQYSISRFENYVLIELGQKC